MTEQSLSVRKRATRLVLGGLMVVVLTVFFGLLLVMSLLSGLPDTASYMYDYWRKGKVERRARRSINELSARMHNRWGY